MTNFNDEALIFMFYTNPGDIQQIMAAQELWVPPSELLESANAQIDMAGTGATTRN
jgi:hypothetical protein